MKVQITQKKSKGYKQTEIGVIPEDWEVVKLNLLSNGIGDGIHSTPKYVDSSNYFFVNGNNLSNGRILITQDTKCISKNEYESLKKNLDNTTILMSINGTIGNLAFFNNETVILGKSAAYIKLSQRIDKIFIYYLLQHSSIKKFYDNELTGTTIKNLSLSSIRTTPIPIPPSKSEQTAIAIVLSDTDALIEHMEKLIVKKKAIKQGTMQQLLTGKKRLPGFNGDWEVKKLGEIGEITGAGIDKKLKSDEIPVRLVNYLDVFHKNFIYSKDLNHWVTAPIKQSQRCVVKKGDIFFTPSSEMRYDIGISAVAMEDIPDAGYSYHVDRLRLFDDWDLAFRTYIFKTKYFLDQAETICEGSGKRYVISLTKFREMTVRYPKDKSEQTAIATILSDMDAEIESLEQKRDKYTMLKQGMMQQLLTGRIRIYDNN